jgi:mRNA-degrading endonuclease toxin of MazEF toxin-antitoxin module
MPARPAELRRGRIFYAVFPFASRFPLVGLDESGAKLDLANVEAFARARKGSATRIVTEARLRPVVLLHDGTRGEHEDVVCLRVNSVKARHRRQAATWRQIEEQRHPVFFFLPAGNRRYGLSEDSIVALTSIGSVHKNAILGRHVGELSHHEMQVVSERLARVLSLDLAPKIAAQAKELLRRAGLAPPG